MGDKNSAVTMWRNKTSECYTGQVREGGPLGVSTADDPADASPRVTFGAADVDAQVRSCCSAFYGKTIYALGECIHFGVQK